MAWARTIAAVGVTAMIGLAGCSSSSSPDSSADQGEAAVDCTAAQAAMDDYSVALGDLATSLEAGDSMSAIAAADAMSYALDQLESSLPGIPAAGQEFLTSSRSVVLRVKQSAADSPQMPGLLGELTAAFADPAFAEGGAAIDGYVAQVCPSESPSPTTP